MVHRPMAHTRDDHAISTGSASGDDTTLVWRIIAAYRRSVDAQSGGGFWQTDFAQMKRDVHDALMSGDVQLVAQHLRNPAGNRLFYGFEAIFKGAVPTPAWLSEYSRLVHNQLMRLCEAVGIIKLANPEAYNPGDPPPTLASPDELLAFADEAFGFRIEFPNPYAEEFGLLTSRGIATLRSIDALYQAWRLWSLCGRNAGARVVEIGGGLGRAAYCAHRIGIGSYTIIDIPLTCVAQAYHLGRTFADHVIELEGESLGRPIRIKSPTFFFEQADRYDIAFNSDSLPEIDPETASRYVEAMKALCGMFLSINHECFMPVRQTMGVPAEYRFPYWIRRGYVEELYRFS
jgi:hypothetical protein